MAELATIIKEVAEQLVEYFNKRRLEVGWDDSNPKNVVTHLIPKPKLANKTISETVQRYPELRKLLTLLETEGFAVDEPKTEMYIKSALEECISKMNFLTYQDLWQTLGNATKPVKKISEFSKEERHFTTEKGEVFPPVTGMVVPSRKAIAPLISKSSAERIVNHASKMIANLLRLTKTAYVQESERRSYGNEYGTPLSHKSTNRKAKGSSIGQATETSVASLLSTHRRSSVNTPVFKLERVPSLEKDNQDRPIDEFESDIYHLKPTSAGKKPKCTLFTRISTDSASELSGSVTLLKADILKTQSGKTGVAVPDTTGDMKKQTLNESVLSVTGKQGDGGQGTLLQSPGNSTAVARPILKRNLRNFLPPNCSGSTKTDSNWSIHRGGKNPKELPITGEITEVDYSAPPAFTEPHLSVESPILKEFKHADVLSNRDILEQARKYGTPQFVARLRKELKRAKRTTEPFEGYWIPRRHFQSFDLLKNKHEGLKNGARRLQSVPIKPFYSENSGWSTRYRDAPTALIKHRRRAVSITSESSLKDLNSMTSKLSTADAGTRSTLGRKNSPYPKGVQHQQSPASPKPLPMTNVRQLLEVKPSTKKRSTVTKLPRHSVKTCEPTKSERLKKLALVTANALTEALGIPATELKTQLVQGFGEAVVDPKGKAKTGARKASRASELVQTIKEVKTNDMSTTSSSDNVVYRVRVESVRRYRMQQADSYRDFYPPAAAHLPNPTPPMSIVLRGMNCSSPSLELVSAELARLGEVAGHPVILRDPHMLGQRSKRDQPIFGDTPALNQCSPNRTGGATKEGCPQVDYFAVVCSSLGRIIGVDIRPVPSGVKNSRYDWFIKKVTIDELERQKKYHFICEKWLNTEPKTIPCKRARVTAKSKLMQTAVNYPIPENTLSHCSVPQPNAAVLSPIRCMVRMNKTCSFMESPDSVSIPSEDVVAGPAVLSSSTSYKEESIGAAWALRTAVESVLFQSPKTNTLSGFVSTLHSVQLNDLSWYEDNMQTLPHLMEEQTPVTNTVESTIVWAAERRSVIETKDQLSFTQTGFPDSHSLKGFTQSTTDLSVCSENLLTPTGILPVSYAFILAHLQVCPRVLQMICSQISNICNDCDPKATQLTHIDQLLTPDLVNDINTCSPSPMFEPTLLNEHHTDFPRIASIQPYSPECLDEPSEVEQDTYPPTVISGRVSEMEHTASITASQPEVEYGNENKWELEELDANLSLEKGKAVVQTDFISWSSSDELQQELNLFAAVDPTHTQTGPTTDDQAPLQVADVYFDPNYSATGTAADDRSARYTTQETECSNISLPLLNDSALEERLRQIAGLTVPKSNQLSPEDRVDSVPEFYYRSEVGTPTTEETPACRVDFAQMDELGDQSNDNNRESWMSCIQANSWADSFEDMGSEQWEALDELSRSPYMEWDSELGLILNQQRDELLSSVTEIRSEQPVAISMHELML